MKTIDFLNVNNSADVVHEDNNIYQPTGLARKIFTIKSKELDPTISIPSFLLDPEPSENISSTLKASDTSEHAPLGAHYPIALAGTRFDRSLSEKEIAKIKDAKDPSEITSIFCRITDWFCGSNKEAAKLALYNVLKEDHSDTKKLSGFLQLQRLSSPDHKKNFDLQIISPETIKASISGLLIMDINVDHRLAPAMEKIQKDYGWNTLEERIDILKKDFPRLNFCFNGTDFYSVSDKIPHDEKIDYIESFLENKTSNQYQQKMLGILATQSSVLALKSMAMEHISNKFQPLGANHKICYNIQNLQSGDIQVDIQYSNHMPSKFAKIREELGNPFTDVALDATFIIGKKNTLCTKIECWGDGCPLTMRSDAQAAL